MSMIGVRELRQQASEFIRRVREEQAEFVITYQGRPVAILLPLDTERAEAEMVQAGKKAVPGAQAYPEPVVYELGEPAAAYAARPQATVPELEDRIVQAAQEIARQCGQTMDEILSGLARRPPGGEARNGVPLFPVQPGAGPVTLELVNQLRDETP